MKYELWKVGLFFLLAVDWKPETQTCIEVGKVLTGGLRDSSRSEGLCLNMIFIPLIFVSVIVKFVCQSAEF